MKKAHFCTRKPSIRWPLKTARTHNENNTDPQILGTVQTTLPQKEIFGTTADRNTVYKFPDGTLTIRNSQPIAHRSCLCLETQHYPTPPNQPEFPSAVLRPGEKYSSKTVFKFSIK